jgi:hypothetical protein
MLKKIVLATLGVLALCIVAVLAVAATKPDSFRIARSITVAAPADRVFPLVNDLRIMKTWSPFEKDPSMQRTFSADSAGKGATYAWDGNYDVGAGNVEITQSTAPSKIVMKLTMLRPIEGSNDVEFSFEPAAGGSATLVTWVMQGEQPFLGKIIDTLFDCEKMAGREFEKGLAQLKTLAETQTGAIPR